MQDDFNLTGLSAQVPYYEYALDTILDAESATAARFSKDQQESIESAAELLYGLIHARYIITPRGMTAMLEKVGLPPALWLPCLVRSPLRPWNPRVLHCLPTQYKMVHFGRCPRVHCQGQPVLPVGQSDLPRMHTTKIYCCRCEDIYYPRSSRQANVDGAYFGTTFCHLFLQSYLELQPAPATTLYVPRIFGFKLHRPQGPRITSQGRANAAAVVSPQQAGGSGGAGSSGAAGGGSASAAAGARAARASHDGADEGGDDGGDERTPGGSQARKQQHGSAGVEKTR